MPQRIHPAHPVGAAQAPAGAHARHAHEMDAAPTPDGTSDCDGDCDRCIVCHLASSGFLLTGDAGVTALLATEVRASPALATPPSHVTAPPRHPPRRTA